MKTLQSIVPDVSIAGGKTIAVTAEPEEQLQHMLGATGYAAEVIVDTKNEIAAELKRRGTLNVAISDKAGYEHGMAQPAVLVMKNDGTVLYMWAIVPGVMNLGGAKDRPNLKQIWENALAQMRGQPMVHKKYALQSLTQVMRQKIFG